MAKLTTSQNGINFIKAHEGLCTKAYKDSGGVLTIGYGHTGGVKSGQTITKSAAENLLKEDLVRFESRVNYYRTNYYKTMNQNQFDALVSFAFNLGNGNLDNLTQNGKRSLAKLPDFMVLYVHCNGQVLKGLKNRRNDEVTLFNTPVEAKSEVDYSQVVADVIAGKYGSGATRRIKLTKAGYPYKTIQALVNEALKGK